MAESMRGLKRSHRCTEVTKAEIGSTVTLMGWVQKSRNKGGIVFVDLRDRSGIMQIIFENGEIDEQGFEKAGRLRSEFVIAVKGHVEARSGAVNTPYIALDYCKLTLLYFLSFLFRSIVVKRFVGFSILGIRCIY